MAVQLTVAELAELVRKAAGAALDDHASRRAAGGERLSAGGVARRLRRRRSDIFRALATGEMKGCRVGRGWSVTAADADLWAANTSKQITNLI